MTTPERTRWPSIATLLFVLAACPVQMLHAKRLEVYDRDSLIYLSTDVAEAEIIRSYQADTLKLIDVKVTHIHKGGFKTGQTVVVAHTDFYRKPKKDDFNPQPLAAGDRLVLFVVRMTRTEFNRIPENAVIYGPLPGGMRLVQGDHVFSFSQWGSPGPSVADVPPDAAKAKLLTIGRFREEVRKSLRETQGWARFMEAQQDELDVPRLMKLLADRSKGTRYHRDHFAERICVRFAETHDLILLTEALALAKRHHEISILQFGFGTPQGRDCLLAKVNDAKEPMPSRLRNAFALHHAGVIYRSTFTDIRVNGHRVVGEADEGNSGYITRIAKAASSNRQHEELCTSLIRCIDFFGPGNVQNQPPPLMEDLRGALAVLKDLYDAKPSEELRFAIERATAWDQIAYAKLKSPCGTFISILRRANPTDYGPPKRGSLLFVYECATPLLSRGMEVQPSVVMIHQGTQKRYVFPSNIQIRGGGSQGGSHSVILPKDLPAGRYHVFFQLSDGDQIVSTGHYFVVDL